MTTIRVSEGSASELAQTVQTHLSEYLNFSLNILSEVTPTPGGSAHDELSGSIANALLAWNDLIASDAQAVIEAALEIESLDMALAGSLLGARETEE